MIRRERRKLRPCPSLELRRRFHQQLGAIDAKVIRLFALVTEGWRPLPARCCRATAAARALADQDAVVDELVDLEQVAEHELLTQTPMAGDMRYLVSVLRVVPELERSGDLAEHIAQRAATGLALRLTPTVRGRLEQMGSICSSMWRRAADVGRARRRRARPRLRRRPARRAPRRPRGRAGPGRDRPA